MTKQLATGPINALICVFFIVLGLFVVIGPVGASALLDENFDSYDLGPVSGQGDWYGGGPAYAISNDRAWSGTQSLQLTGSAESGLKIDFAGGTLNDYYLEFDFYVESMTHTEGFAVALVSPEAGSLYNQTQNVSGSNNLYTNNEGGSAGGCGGLATGEWHSVKILATFDPSFSVRFSCDNYPFSDPQTGNTIGGIGTGFITLNIQKLFYYSGGEVYIDNIYLDTTACIGFIDRTSCIAGGCYWENIIFHEEYSFCRSLVVGEEGFCEYSIFGCAYCNSSTTCAGATGCNWNGLSGCSYFENLCEFEHLENCENETDCENASGTWNGDFCFVSDTGPVDCSSMPLLERLVCEIKNFISSAFLPSKAKLTELGQAIDLINTKFPSNYLRAGRVFFDNVKNGISESEGIPVKILGHEQDISFDIFNATGTAGVVGTLGNFLKVFFNLVFITIFITWALSFLKRIFK